MTTRIAHFSDLHVLALDGVGVGRYLNKRLTGVANLALRRAPLEELSGAWRAAAERVPSRFRKKEVHRADYVRAIAREVATTRVDHVVITGDITNLALEPEFAAARLILEGELHLGPRDVSIIPGNHDHYTRGAVEKNRFAHFFAEYMHSDLEIPGDFPFVRLRGPLAIVGLSSAVPRAPFVAAGELGEVQLDALSRVLEHDEVKKRTLVVLVHHPPTPPRSRAKRWMESLRDGDALLARLAGLEHAVVLHGHLHKRVRSVVTTRGGEIVIAGAASASLHHGHAARMSGFNVYEFDDHGALVAIDAHVLDRDPTTGTDTFHKESVPAVAIADYW